jgi:hypothetical protein
MGQAADGDAEGVIDPLSGGSATLSAADGLSGGQPAASPAKSAGFAAGYIL